MRISAFVAFALTVAAAFAPRPATAAYNLPWCAQHYDMGTVLSCAFYTQEQCLATVSGAGGFCRKNFRYQPQPYDATPRRAKPRRNSGYH